MPSAACQSRCCPQGLLQVEEMADFPRLPVGRPPRHSWPGTHARPPPPCCPARPIPGARPRCDPSRGESVLPAGHPVWTASRRVRRALGSVPDTALGGIPPGEALRVGMCAPLGRSQARRLTGLLCPRTRGGLGRPSAFLLGLGVVVSRARASAGVRPWAIDLQVTEESGIPVPGHPGCWGRTGRVA